MRFYRMRSNTNRLKLCFYGKIGEVCGDDAVEFADSMMKRMFGRIATVACQDLDPFGNKCTSLPPTETNPKGEYRGANSQYTARQSAPKPSQTNSYGRDYTVN